MVKNWRQLGHWLQSCCKCYQLVSWVLVCLFCPFKTGCKSLVAEGDLGSLESRGTTSHHAAELTWEVCWGAGAQKERRVMRRACLFKGAIPHAQRNASLLSAVVATVAAVVATVLPLGCC